MPKKRKEKNQEPQQSTCDPTISNSVFRQAVFSILKDNASTLRTSFSLSTLQSATEKKLELKAGSLKTSKWKEKLLALLDTYNSIFHSMPHGTSSFSSSSSSQPLASGKFSSSESDLIVEVVRDFMSENNLDFADFIPELRPAGSKDRKRHSVWLHLEALLPHRNRQTIMQHAVRKLAPIAGMRFGWDEEDKKKLMELVAMSNNNVQWIEIGRELNRLADECKSCYNRLSRDNWNPDDHTAAVKKNFFTREEDAHILRAICQNCSTKRIERMNEIPTKDLPWKAIAISFAKLQEVDETAGRRRSDKDLGRRWPNIKALVHNKFGDNATVSDAIEFLETCDSNRCDSGNGKTVKSMEKFENNANKIFMHIKLLNVQDESEITWTDIDSKFCLPYTTSRRIFKSVKKLITGDSNEESFEDVVEEGLRMYPPKITSKSHESSRKRIREAVDVRQDAHGEKISKKAKKEKKKKNKKDKKKRKK